MIPAAWVPWTTTGNMMTMMHPWGELLSPLAMLIDVGRRSHKGSAHSMLPASVMLGIMVVPMGINR
jgi:ABC-type phosphate transport system permease subunit